MYLERINIYTLLFSITIAVFVFIKNEKKIYLLLLLVLLTIFDKINLNKNLKFTDLSINALDDSNIICKQYEKMLENNNNSIVVRPQTLENLQNFINLCLNEKIDCVILDQNIKIDQNVYYGTNICRQLRKKNFNGIIVIRSSDNDIKKYEYAGADTYIGKDVKLENVKNTILNFCSKKYK